MAPTASGFRKHAGRKNQQVNENIFFLIHSDESSESCLFSAWSCSSAAAALGNARILGTESAL